MLGLPGKLPDIYETIKIRYQLLRVLLGVRSNTGTKSDKVRELTEQEVLRVNVRATTTGGVVAKIEKVNDFLIKRELNCYCTQGKQAGAH